VLMRALWCATYSRQYSWLSRSYSRSWRSCGSSLLRPAN